MLVDGRMPRAVIFDLDGTLTDNMALHAQAFERFALRHGLPPLTLAMRGRLDGKRNRDIFPILFERELPAGESEAYSQEKESIYRTLSQGKLRPLAGTLRLLAALRKRSVPVAVATSAPAENVKHTLAEIGLQQAFPHVVRSDEVPHGKPAPDVFLAAAQRVEAAPADCLVFEDAPMGVAAALAAGMTCVAVNSAFSGEQFAAHDAVPHFQLADFDAYLSGPGVALL
jgi:beta-phosphoglucomutase family hydrolase